MHKGILMFFLILIVGVPSVTHAILPPDFIFSLGSQFAYLFSMIALISGAIFGSVVVALRPYFIFFKKHTCSILFLLMFIVFSTVSVVFYVQDKKNKEAYEKYIAMLETQIASSTTETAVQISTSNETGTVYDDESWGEVSGGDKIFQNDTFVIYSDDFEKPFYLEIDLNRRKTPSGVFMHYYYLTGVYEGNDANDYHYSHEVTAVPTTTDFITYIDRKTFSDLSTREEYTGEVTVNGEKLAFEITGIEGDFLTKGVPAYTRYQSVGNASVTFKGKTFDAHAFVERIYSDDFSKYLFFDGYAEIDSDTVQFTFWDKEGNFYMIDNSNVYSDTPQYPSHTWILSKDSFGKLKKGFSADIVVNKVGGVEKGWTITLPEIENSKIELSLVRYIDDGDKQTRLRALVTGSVTDTKGTRELEGFAHIIK